MDQLSEYVIPDIIKIINNYATHSEYNQELYLKKPSDQNMLLDIPLSVCQFDQKLFWKGICCHRACHRFMGKYCNMISIRSSCHFIDPPGLSTYLIDYGLWGTCMLYMQCSSCYRWFGFDYIENNNEYDGVVTIHLNVVHDTGNPNESGEERKITKSPFKIIIL